MKQRSSGRKPSLEELIQRFAEVENATLVESPPGRDYAYELKYDGYRIIAFKLGSSVRLISRRRQDWTSEFSVVAAALEQQLAEHDLVLDGEVVALDERGVPSFQRLQHRKPPLAYVLFDVLWADGRDVRGEPLEARRALLDELLPKLEAPLARSTAVSGEPQQLLSVACRSGFEGLIGKRVGSPYRPGRGLDWIKLKCQLRQEFVIAGYLPFTGSQNGIVGSLVLALRERDTYVFAGKVGTGFDSATRSALGKMLEQRVVKTSRVPGVPRFGGLVRFVELGPVAEVRFSEWTDGGHARHPSFVGLRPDKRPEDCVREGTAPAPRSLATPAKTRAGALRKDAGVSVLNISLSHPERVLDPLPLTKLELARYYEAVAEWMLPHVQGRPLTLLRWAEGKPTEKGGVYLRHTRAWGPSVLTRVRIVEQKKVGEYLVVEDSAGLVALAQMDILEIHGWNSTRDDVERPNRIVFDLDPGPHVKWSAVVRAANDLRALLDSVGLESWLKTSGGKGLHLVVPLVPEHDWPTCHAASRTIAEQFAASNPKAYTTNVQKDERGAKILIDYLRNARGNTSVAAYSTRAKPGATVSTPIHWDELSRRLDNAHFGVKTLPRRLASLRVDPWKGYFTSRQRLLSR
jgi:bifunctional non-homologous end joining protein LigD